VYCTAASADAVTIINVADARALRRPAVAAVVATEWAASAPAVASTGRAGYLVSSASEPSCRVVQKNHFV